MAKNLFHPQFRNNRVLLLQGPVGPFFKRLSKDLRTRKNSVFKINFNAGDCFFYPNGLLFRDSIDTLDSFLSRTIQENQINAVVLFGDCRPIHRVALKVATDIGIQIFVFEEGYIRPNHITLEQVGVNGYSLLPKNAEYYYQQIINQPEVETEIGKTYWYATLWAVLYYTAASLGSFRFPNYQHHRPLNISEGVPWLIGGLRKLKFKFRERKFERRLSHELKNQYFLTPLQVPSDAQIEFHSNFSNVSEFIQTIISSFATYAPQDTFLVIKQHPFDRGYNDYTDFIHQLSHEYTVADRVLYIHDQHLPTLLKNARGVVTINSTVGLSAIHHSTPTIVCGEAVYDIPQMCFQGNLDDFWQQAAEFTVSHELYDKYIAYLEQRCQINGSFYRRIKNSGNHAGLNLSRENFT